MKDTLFISEDKRPDRSDELAQKAWEIAFLMEERVTNAITKIQVNNPDGTDIFLSE